MGAWGLKSFENDDAADWVYTFAEDGADAIKAALDAVLDDDEDEIEAPGACEALAAAELVAAAHTGDASRLSGEAETALQNHPDGIATPENMVLARDAVGLVKDKSELRDLWAESEDFDGWLKDVEALEALLS